MAKDVTYQKYKAQRRPPKPGLKWPSMGHFPWLAVLVAINVAVVVYHGDPRDMMAQASDLEAQPVVVAQAVATEKPSIEAPIVAAAPTAAVEQAPEPDTTR